MPRSVRRFAAALAVAALVLAPAAGALADVSLSGTNRLESETTGPIMDAVLLRPLGLMGLGLAGAIFVPAELVTLAVRPGEWRKPVDTLIMPAYEFVFVDPIGSH